MRKFIEKTIKATIINIIVALFIIVGIIIIGYLFCGTKIEETISLINKVSIDIENKEEKETVMNEQNKIQNYPEYTFFWDISPRERFLFHPGKALRTNGKFLPATRMWKVLFAGMRL